MSRTLHDVTLTGGSLFLTAGAKVSNQGLPIVLPTTGAGVLVTSDTAQTITNKVITNINNDVAANRFHDAAGAWTVSLTGPAPNLNDVLAYNGSGSATWVPNSADSTLALTTNNATATPFTPAITTANNTATYVSSTIVAYDTTTPANNSTFVLKGSFSTDAAGVVTATAPSTDLTYFGPDPEGGPTLLNVAYTNAVANTISLVVTGIAAQTIKWTARVTVVNSGP